MAKSEGGNGSNGSRKIMVRLESVSPILMNPATKELLDTLEFGAATNKNIAKDTPSKEKAEKKLIRDGEDGPIGIPAEYLFSCLREAGRHVAYTSKMKISTKESTLLPAFLDIKEIFFPFIDQNVPWKVDRRKGQMDSGGKKVAVTIVRPRFDSWSCWVTVEIDTNPETGIAPEKIRELFTKAGKMIGLGDFRPACNGVFGRFRVAEWIEMPLTATIEEMLEAKAAA
jgi:hypothetical protein